MFDIGWSELLVVMVIALIVIGPKELPQLIYQLGKQLSSLRALAEQGRRYLDNIMQEAELHELQRDLHQTSQSFPQHIKPLSTEPTITASLPIEQQSLPTPNLVAKASDLSDNSGLGENTTQPHQAAKIKETLPAHHPL